MGMFVLGSYVSANSLYVQGLPAVGESVCADAMLNEHGGKGLNLAVALHRLNGDVRLLVGVGDDAQGNALADFLQDEGIGINGVIKLGRHSGFGVGLVAFDGGNVIAVYRGANALLDSSHITDNKTLLHQVNLVCAQFEVNDAPILATFRYAKERGITTLLNPSPWRAIAHDLLSITDILVVNVTEAAHLLALSGTIGWGVSEWQTALQHIDWNGKLLVVTLAEQGCLAVNKDGVCIHVPAFPIVVVDPTGAGDAFTAGFAKSWLAGTALKEALYFANACGAMVAAQQGVIRILPTQASVLAFMDSSSM